ncbi:hypothetical protein AVEN_201783-1 [Araneus ventricosus]|uniref:Uncharacterized protein n=1 Tax=Araneus ventricosus TaxID=182803 RepID=A0A4Y2MPR9_ARAVE|nr:hypothetical protein AVEN_156492-1 [Araneus ventricosus]GBN28320.1 hypothetical protein AVEN_201783-1 [Araneus ventricosus]
MARKTLDLAAPLQIPAPHHREKLTLEEALLLFDELNSDSDLEDIYMDPPDVAVVSDEDSAKEDEGGLTDNLSGRQLRVNVEISREKTRRKETQILLRNKK